MSVGIGFFKGKLLFSPEFIRRVFKKRLLQEGLKAIMKDRRHQINREMWIGAIFALGLIKGGNDPIYCTPGPKGSSPDVYGINIGQNDSGQVAFIHQWEIVEYNKFSSAQNKVA